MTIFNKPVYTIIHQTNTVHMAPYMVHTLLQFNVLEEVDSTTYKVVDEQKYWKVLDSLN